MWDKDKIESLFPQQIVNRILGIPLFDMVEEDKLIWVDSTYGQYSVKSGYNLIQGRGRARLHRRIGVVCGKFMLLRRPNISYGAYVDGVFLALYYVQFVPNIMKMIGIFCSLVMIVFKQDKLPA
jgi:hypothetical protein